VKFDGSPDDQINKYTVNVYESKGGASVGSESSDSYDGTETQVKIKDGDKSGPYYVVVKVNDGAASDEQSTGSNPDLRPPVSDVRQVGTYHHGFAAVKRPGNGNGNGNNGGSGTIADFCVANGNGDVSGGFVGGPTAIANNVKIKYDDSLDTTTIVAPGELIVPPIAHLHLSVTELEVESD
jgi:hypothetical protein